MSFIRILVVSGIIASIFFSAGCFADTGHGKTAVYELAEILHRLKHYPSPQGKKELQVIVDAQGSTENEKVIAKAIMSFMHEPAAHDIPVLQKIADDKGASPDERELASIILNLGHRPTRQDKSRLKALMK